MTPCPSEQAILDFLDGKLAPARGAEIHQHVDGCAACRALLASLAPSINRSTIDQYEATQPPEGVARTAPLTAAPPTGADTAAPAESAAVLPLVSPDRYVVRDEFARGGLGRIFRAHDRRLARPVAVKQLLAGGSEAARRFIREALITARLQHPAIVPIYEAGRWPSGEPFYAMKLVSGRSLDQVIRGKRALAERLTLLPNIIAVAEAMAYAHSQRIIHRDLKPANVLVGSFGETVLIDWGLAKDLTSGAEAGSDPMLRPLAGDDTEVGTILGTPTYMPPEQAEGKAVDERADVYALGAMLYDVLAGAPPYTGSSSAETLARVLAGPPTALAAREPGVPRDLVTVVEKAMARDPAARYPTAKELAEDLVRFQAGQLVSAHRYSTAEMMRRWVQRRRASVSVAVALLTALAMTGALAVTRIAHERDAARRERAEARAAQAQAEKRSSELTLAQAEQSLDHDPTAAVAWLKQYPDTGDWRAAQSIFADAVSRGVAERVFAGVSRATFLADGRLAQWGEDGRVRLWSDAGGDTLADGAARIEALAAAADGKRLALRRADDTVELWDVTARRRLLTVPHAGLDFALAPDGARLAVVGDDGSVDLWSADGSHRRLAGAAGIRLVAFAGATLVSAGEDRKVRAWDLDAGRSRVLGGHDAAIVVLDTAPDGRRAASVDSHSRVALWSLAGGAPRSFAGRGESGSSFAFGPHGAFAAAIGGGAVAVLDGRGVAHTLRGHTSMVDAIAFLPDGRLITAGEDQLVRLWDVATGDSVPLRGHASPVVTVSVAPDGARFATGSADKTVRLWRVPAGHRRLRLSDVDALYAVAFSPDGSHVAAAGSDGLVDVCDVASAACRALAGHRFDVNAVVYSHDGTHLATAGDDGVRVWELPSGRSRALPAAEQLMAVAFSPDDTRVAYRAGRGRVVEVELATGKTRTLAGASFSPLDVAYAPDGRLVAIPDENDVVLWDPAHGTSRRLRGHTSFVRRAFFSPDGTRLASASEDGTIGLWLVADGSVRFLRGHDNFVNWVAFSPDGKRLASTGFDGDVRLWDVATGQPLRVLRGHQGAARRVVFSPSGKLVASGGDDHTVRLWSVDGGDSYVLRGHDLPVRDVAFARNGALLASVSADGTLRLTRLDALPQPLFGGHDARTLRPLIERATSAVMGPADRPVSY